MGEKCINVLVRKPEGKRLLGRPGRRWENILNWILKPYVGSVCGLYSSGSE
jgi:hypothetical protein